MLQITVIKPEFWDEVNEVFIPKKEWTLDLEHSLVSLSKWESKWLKPFLSSQEKTVEETMDYIKDMTLTPDVDPEVYDYISDANAEEIYKYIYAPMTATTFPKGQTGKSSNEIITAELVYYWMVALNIPFECQHWHLNKLITLIRVCEAKSQPPKKMSKREAMSQQAALNAARRKRLNSKG